MFAPDKRRNEARIEQHRLLGAALHRTEVGLWAD